MSGSPTRVPKGAGLDVRARPASEPRDALRRLLLGHLDEEHLYRARHPVHRKGRADRQDRTARAALRRGDHSRSGAGPGGRRAEGGRGPATRAEGGRPGPVEPTCAPSSTDRLNELPDRDGSGWPAPARMRHSQAAAVHGVSTAAPRPRSGFPLVGSAQRLRPITRPDRIWPENCRIYRAHHGGDPRRSAPHIVAWSPTFSFVAAMPLLTSRPREPGLRPHAEPRFQTNPRPAESPGEQPATRKRL